MSVDAVKVITMGLQAAARSAYTFRCTHSGAANGYKCDVVSLQS